MPGVHYDSIGSSYASQRRADPRRQETGQAFIAGLPCVKALPGIVYNDSKR